MASRLEPLNISFYLTFKMVCVMHARTFQSFISQVARILVQVALLAVFLHFFGLPAIARFAKMDIMVVETTKQTNGIPVPAITITAPSQIKGHSCFGGNSSIDVCLERITHKQSNLLKSVVLGFRDKKEILITDEIIRSDYTYSRPGIYSTLTLPMTIGPNRLKDQLFIGLNTNLTYVVYLHDAEYFLMNENPTSTPSIHRRFTTSAEKTTGWFYKLSLVEVNMLNLPKSPCVEDPNYSFLSCVRRSIASKVRENNISVSLVTKFSKNMCIKIKGWLPNKVGCVERTINTFMYIWGPV